MLAEGRPFIVPTEEASCLQYRYDLIDEQIDLTG
jgi:hypothetical protein